MTSIVRVNSATAHPILKTCKKYHMLNLLPGSTRKRVLSAIELLWSSTWFLFVLQCAKRLRCNETYNIFSKKVWWEFETILIFLSFLPNPLSIFQKFLAFFKSSNSMNLNIFWKKTIKFHAISIFLHLVISIMAMKINYFENQKEIEKFWGFLSYNHVQGAKKYLHDYSNSMESMA